MIPPFPDCFLSSDRIRRKDSLRKDSIHPGKQLRSINWQGVGIMKHLFTIAVLLFAACGLAFGDTASDERELTQLVKDLNAAIVKPDMAFLERVLDKDYSHYRPHGNVENRAQYLEDRKTGTVDFDSLVADDIKVRVYGDTAIVTYRSTARGKDQDGE